MRIPSPCIDVCKYKLRGGRCIGCSMTERQKAMFMGLPGEEAQRDFVLQIVDQQAEPGARFLGWANAYRRKCAKEGVPCPLDDERPGT